MKKVSKIKIRKKGLDTNPEVGDTKSPSFRDRDRTELWSRLRTTGGERHPGGFEGPAYAQLTRLCVGEQALMTSFLRFLRRTRIKAMRACLCERPSHHEFCFSPFFSSLFISSWKRNVSTLNSRFLLASLFFKFFLCVR